ncbi:MAG: L-lactate dehydrogenase, partial [Clostridia bacterium]|nr:L-lactate dehydrogenase [Clostridia bacterium]
MNKVVLIGCGNVGMSYAYCLVNESKVDELVLIDINYEKAQGEALDLLHASSCAKRKIKIKAGDYADCQNADIVCIAAGRNQEVGETRLDLIDKNVAVFSSIIKEINKTGFNGIYLIATNPLDVMTFVTLKLSNFPKEKVIGSGTTLDTARLRFLISEQLQINPKNIHAYVIGEHGDSEMIPWSSAMIGLSSVDKFLNKSAKAKIYNDVKNSAYEIINKKGNTAYGIGMC